ncbi:PR domain zinc finger protein 14-like [Actinia tenebrosa]|uniref:PR domain zinc finger protein 14-like n=1 Tax=Actinia tenebrosa TaxID=6105 RepID=A0A6P8HRG7_ACTTE|nr:PR domain zinc finger protein 14-like [Actinia tenebrosa]
MSKAEGRNIPTAKIPSPRIAEQPYRKSTWKFTSQELVSSLYGYFTIQDDSLTLDKEVGSPDEMPSPKSSADLIFSKFTYGGISETQTPLTKPPSALPDGFRLVTVTMGRGIHYAIFCNQKVIMKGTRFGPYTGYLVKPGDLSAGEDNPHMWEVFKNNRLSYYIDGTTDDDNWLKFVNCARQSIEQNLAVVQENDKIYYEASRDIFCGEELLVWYGKTYEMYMGIPVGVAPTATKITENKKEIQKGTTGNYYCDRCNKVFAYKYYRDRHLKYTRCVDQGDRRFPCSLCDRSFDKRDRLRIHVLHVHEKHRPHQCTVCDKRFSQSSSLNKHMRVHSGERPYRCPHCEKAFTASSILRTHIRQHSGEKPFKCKHCGRAFASHAAHDSHVRRTHTKEKPCVCEYCGKAFAQSYELKFHINMHTGAKPYTCEKCGRGFSSPSSRDRHRANFDCTTRKNRAPKVMRKSNQLIGQTTNTIIKQQISEEL